MIVLCLQSWLYDHCKEKLAIKGQNIESLFCDSDKFGIRVDNSNETSFIFFAGWTKKDGISRNRKDLKAT